MTFNSERNLEFHCFVLLSPRVQMMIWNKLDSYTRYFMGRCRNYLRLWHRSLISFDEWYCVVMWRNMIKRTRHAACSPQTVRSIHQRSSSFAFNRLKTISKDKKTDCTDCINSRIRISMSLKYFLAELNQTFCTFLESCLLILGSRLETSRVMSDDMIMMKWW